MLVFIILIGIVVLAFWIHNQTGIRPAIRAAQHPMKPDIPPERRAFFEDVFGITTLNEKVPFDGWRFHSDQAHDYRKFRRLRVARTKAEEHSNPDLPHMARWLRSRVDGGPDRRFSVNYQVLSSVRHDIRLVGPTDAWVCAYEWCDWTDRIEKELDGYNRLLDAARLHNVEEAYEEYLSIREPLVALNQEWERKQARPTYIQHRDGESMPLSEPLREYLDAVEAMKACVVAIKRRLGVLDERYTTLRDDWRTWEFR